ncbi:MAG: sugar ABC transporter ATP-binding protein [Hyphomonas sp.]|nr:sugar ABC transporter ATP-binding protein [Hyphomonas sp.]
MTEPAPNPASARLVISGLEKSFGTNTVLKGIEAEFGSGEITALLGANGAGKSTLIKILCGVYSADAGTMVLDGDPINFTSPMEAMASGVRLLPQEISIVAELSVAENVLLGDLPVNGSGFAARLDRGEMRRRTESLLERVGLDVRPDIQVRDLSLQQMRLVEIARALAGNARLLIMDEPTASMSDAEKEELFGNLRRLRDAGTSIIFISHYLDEVLAISDRIHVLKDGRISGTFEPKTTTEADILVAMLGRQFDELFPPVARAAQDAPETLRLDGVSLQKGMQDIDLVVRAGETVGMFGMLGSGVENFGHALFAKESRIAGGRAIFEGAPMPNSAAGRISAGIGYLPAERKRDAIVPQMSISENIALPRLELFSRAGKLNKRRMHHTSAEKSQLLSVRCQSVFQPIGELSGGNQQKACLSRWIDDRLKLLVLEEPTRGVDMGAREEIYKKIRVLTDQGVAVLLISSDVDEIAGCSARVNVVRDRRIVGEFTSGASPEDLMAAAASSERGRHVG